MLIIIEKSISVLLKQIDKRMILVDVQDTKKFGYKRKQRRGRGMGEIVSLCVGLWVDQSLHSMPTCTDCLTCK